MNWSDIDLRPGSKKLRQFAAIWLVVFGLLAYFRHSHAFAFVAAIGLIGLALPVVMRPVYVAATVVTFPIGWVVSRVLLAVIYFVVITPVALLFKLIGRDELRLKGGGGETYWRRKEMPGDSARYLRQY